MSPLLKLEFTGQSVDAPRISISIRKFDIDINMLSSQIDYTGRVNFGVMLAELHEINGGVEAAIKFLKEHHLKVEVLGYV